jgi:hypothetical protein
VLVSFFNVSAVYAIWVVHLPFLIQLFGSLTIVLIAICQWRKLSQSRTLIHQDEEQIWIEKNASGSDTRGTLIPAGYRSAGLLVLVLQLDNDRYYRIVVWRDSVSRQQFSYLHHQLAFATTTARRRSLNTILSLR